MAEEVISTYKVKSGGFEGPLELLLSLIESRKLFVNDVSLASVTEDYIAYVKNLAGGESERHIADVSYFILVAATLILIKSKSLLPNLALTEDETEKITDLETRLKLYQTIKNASILVKNQFGTEIIFAPMDRNWSEPLFSPDPAINVSSMSQAVQDVITHIPKKEAPLPEIEIVKVMSMEEMINSLTERIESAMNISFREFSKSHGGQNEKEVKINVIVSFLAMLELVREGILDVVQNATFEDIEINKQNGTTI